MWRALLSRVARRGAALVPGQLRGSCDSIARRAGSTCGAVEAALASSPSLQYSASQVAAARELDALAARVAAYAAATREADALRASAGAAAAAPAAAPPAASGVGAVADAAAGPADAPSSSSGSPAAVTTRAPAATPTSLSATPSGRPPSAASVAPVDELPAPPRGLYIYGPVGAGKTMLMDYFFTRALPAARVPARRVHFHSFMLEVHARCHAWKRGALAAFGRSRHVDARPERDAVVAVGAALAREARVLCLDEFMVNDVADAILLRRLFRALWAGGAVVVATSNRPPAELYEGGLQREYYFEPFLADLARHARELRVDAGLDFRALGAVPAANAFLVRPSTAALARALEPLLRESSERSPPADSAPPRGGGDRPPPPAPSPAALAAAAPAALAALPRAAVPLLFDRTLRLRLLAPRVGVASFAELCEAPVAAADYQGVASAVDVLVLLGVPRLRAAAHNEARRFITLVDTLYDEGVRLVLTAAAPIDDLFEGLTPTARQLSHAAGDAGAPVTAAPTPAPAFTPPSLLDEPRPLPADDRIAGAGTAYAADPAAQDDHDAPGDGAGPGDAWAGGDGGGGVDNDNDGGARRFDVEEPEDAARAAAARAAAATAAAAAAAAAASPAAALRAHGVRVSAAELAALGELTFAARRAASRLVEMTSTKWRPTRQRGAGGGVGSGVGAGADGGASTGGAGGDADARGAA